MRTTILFILLLLPFWAPAQKARLIASSSTDWSGGVAGSSGTRYVFTIAFPGCNKKDIEQDTLWIGDRPTALVVKTNDAAYFNTVVTSAKKSITYTINAAVDHSRRFNSPDPYRQNTNAINPVKAPMQYNGVALLAYRYKGKRCYFTISKIITKYPDISYP